MINVPTRIPRYFAAMALRQRRRWPIMVTAVVVVVAALVAGITVWLCGGGPPAHGDRRQVVAAIRRYYTVEREQGLAAASALACKDIRDSGAALPQDGSRQDITIDKIAHVVIQGDTATAEVTAHVAVNGTPEVGSDTVELRLQREHGTWRFCTFPD